MEKRICGRCKKEIEDLEEHPAAEYCISCRKMLRKDSLRKASIAVYEAAQKKKREKKFGMVQAQTPDSSLIYLRNEEEKDFYQKRSKQYLADFEWNLSADGGLLARLLFLELECKRLEDELTEKQNAHKTDLLMKLTEQIRKVQTNLGIDRLKRISLREEENAPKVMEDLLERFKKYRERNKDRFIWKCEYCNKLNYLHREKSE